MYERRYRRRSNRYFAERRFEAVTYAILIGVCFIPTLVQSMSKGDVVRPAFMLVVGGAVLLGSAIYQGMARFRTNPFTWVGGFAMVMLGINNWDNHNMPGGTLLPIIIIGAIIGFSFLNGDL